MLDQDAQSNPFPLSRRQRLVGFRQKINHLRLDHPARNGDFHAIEPFMHDRQRAALRGEDFVQHVVAASLAFHQAQVVEHSSHFVVATHGLVQDILRRHAQGQQARVDDLEPVGVEVQKDVAALGVRAVD